MDQTDVEEVRVLLVEDDAALAQMYRVKLERDGYTCQICGQGAGEPSRVTPGRRVVLQADHIVPDGPTEANNLRATCNDCNEGRSNLHTGAAAINALVVIRRASRDVQLEVYSYLKKRFDGGQES